MHLKSLFLAAGTSLVLAACSPSGETDGATDPVSAETPPAETTAPEADTSEDTASDAASADKLEGASAGTYSLEPTHAFLTFTVRHNGLSEYTVNFTDFDATMEFNPDDPTSSSIEVTIDPMALNVHLASDFKEGHPDSPYDSWPQALSRDARFLNADEFPEITFVSTGAEKTGDYTGTVTGDLTFLGETKPVTLDVTYNGVGNQPWYGERDLIGFNAKTTINRSEFGQDSLEGIISDEVVIEFSGEFLQDEAPADAEAGSEPTEEE
ncbi:YceI family protein [Henriciella aquimarina]|uniref:YceI family protein n=1 Tax=Henriciella aquimarina TaxID=545261 RepID=UPI000A04E0C6|nr:YceI family protein [Henriciella aquimarina]